MNNMDLYANALEAITRLFADKSVSKETCKDNLRTLKDEIDILIESLELD